MPVPGGWNMCYLAAPRVLPDARLFSPGVPLSHPLSTARNQKKSSDNRSPGWKIPSSRTSNFPWEFIWDPGRSDSWEPLSPMSCCFNSNDHRDTEHWLKIRHCTDLLHQSESLQGHTGQLATASRKGHPKSAGWSAPRSTTCLASPIRLAYCLPGGQPLWSKGKLNGCLELLHKP